MEVAPGFIVERVEALCRVAVAILFRGSSDVLIATSIGVHLAERVRQRANLRTDGRHDVGRAVSLSRMLTLTAKMKQPFS